MSIKLKGSSDGSVSFDAPADTSPSGSDITLTLPTSAGSANQFLKNSGIAGELEYSSMVENSSGNVGIGTTNPIGDLSVSNGGASGIELQPEITTNTNRITNYNRSSSTYNNFRLDAAQHEFLISGTEKMRLSSSGRLGVGVDSPSAAIHVENSNTHSSTYYLNTDAALLVHNAESGNGGLSVIKLEGTAAFVYGSGSSTLRFADRQNERMRIGTSGHLMVGTTAFNPGDNNTTTGVSIAPTGKYFFSCANDGGHINRNNAGYILHARNNKNLVGGITVNSNSTAYNTSSDYRLKENVVDLDGAIDRVKQFAPKRFNFISEPNQTVDGFLAHEAQAVVPEAVFGTYNEVDDDGNAVMQGIDQSKLVPLLTAALQEAIAKIETLETKVAALEAA